MTRETDDYGRLPGGVHEIADATVAEMCALARTDPLETGGIRSNHGLWLRRVVNNADTEFLTGGYDVAECRRRVSYPEGLDTLRRFTVALGDMPRGLGVRRRRRWEEIGDEFSRDRFDAGMDHCWATRKREMRMVPCGIIRITYEIGGNGNRSADDLVWAAAVAIALTDGLEDRGYRIEMFALNLNTAVSASRTWRKLLRIKVKDAGDPLDIEAVLLTAAPWWHRVVDWRHHCNEPYPVHPKFGSTSPCPTEFHGMVHIAHAWSERQAKQVMKEAAERLSRL